MTNMIYTKDTSGAIRRLRNKKPTKSYLSALIDHIKFLKTLGFKFDSKGKMKRQYKKSAPLAHSVEQLICNQQVVGSIPINGSTLGERNAKLIITTGYSCRKGYEVIC